MEDIKRKIKKGFSFQCYFRHSHFCFAFCLRRWDCITLFVGNCGTLFFYWLVSFSMPGEKSGMLNISIGLVLICLLLTLIPVINANVYVYELLLIIFRVLTGVCFTFLMSAALDACRKNAGLGSAFLGTFYFLLGGIVTSLVGYGNIFYSSGLIMVVFVLLNFFSLFVLFHKYKGC